MSLPRRLEWDEADPVSHQPEETVWQRAQRYSDQPMTWRTRLFGMGSVTGIVVLILAATLFTWQTFSARPPAPALSVFDVQPPAAPPEPPSEMPPEPERIVPKAAPPLDLPIVEPPIQLPSVNAPKVRVPEEVPDPGPPAERAAAPESKPAPPAPRQSNGKPTWEGSVLAALNKAKRYPREASLRRQQGVPYIRFVMDRQGRVLSARLERSSGHPALDDEAVSLPRRAAPLPKPPEDVPGETIELVVPVEFFMR